MAQSLSSQHSGQGGRSDLSPGGSGWLFAFSPLRLWGRSQLSGKGSQKSLMRGGAMIPFPRSVSTQKQATTSHSAPHTGRKHLVMQCNRDTTGHWLGTLHTWMVWRNSFIWKQRWLSWKVEQTVFIKLLNSNRTSPGPHCRVHLTWWLLTLCSQLAHFKKSEFLPMGVGARPGGRWGTTGCAWFRLQLEPSQLSWRLMTAHCNGQG